MTEVKLTTITIYDYREGEHATPLKRIEEAWCLAGDTGVRAYFIDDGVLYEVHGDDGHWWVVGTLSVHWVEGLQELVASITVSKKDKRRGR